jgi:ABC-type nitrate/sulfonate/bicarbonate transport system substrate-binding protein
LVPEKDVTLLQIGGVESIVPAMQANRVQAGILSYPAILQAKKLGYRVLLDISSLGIPYASTGVSTRAKLIREDPDTVRRYVAAQVEAIALMKRDKSFTIGVMSKYLRTSDRELLSETYGIFADKYLMKVPLPTVQAIQPVLQEVGNRNPKALEQDPRNFFDDSFVRQLESSRFIEGLYK